MFEVVLSESQEIIMTSSRREDAEACLRSLLEVDKVDAFIRVKSMLTEKNGRL